MMKYVLYTNESASTPRSLSALALIAMLRIGVLDHKLLVVEVEPKSFFVNKIKDAAMKKTESMNRVL